MILEIPLQQLPNQTFAVSLGNSNYDLTLNYRLGDMYISIVKDNVPVIYNRVCQNLNLIQGFFFDDNSGTENPTFAGFNDQFKLYWTDEAL